MDAIAAAARRSVRAAGEELPTLPPEEELSLEDLEDEDEDEETTDILDDEGPAEVIETKE